MDTIGVAQAEAMIELLRRKGKFSQEVHMLRDSSGEMHIYTHKRLKEDIE